MATEILMPELGESVHEGTVSRWLKKVGEQVKEDEPIVEIMTDKVNTELPAPATGVLVEIRIPEGSDVKVFEAMGIIEENADEAAKMLAGDGTPPPAAVQESSAKASEEEKPAAAEKAEEEPAVATNSERRWYSPVVRAMAKANNISEGQLSSISGTGAGGRVTKRDLEAYLGGDRPAAASGSGSIAPKPVEPTKAGDGQEIVPLAGMRKMIAEAMVRSHAVPTVSTLIEVDVTTMMEFRSRNKDAFQQQYGVKLTFTPFFIKALTECLLEFPYVNAALMPDNQIVMNKGVQMGIAVSLGEKGEGGLIVPVIRDCHKKDLVALAKDLEEIAGKARGNKLGVTDVQGGTFTLTNPGSYGATLGTPMISAPQAGILGTYGIVARPVIINGMIAIRQIMNVVLTYDHRLVDGLMAGRFLQSFKQKLEAFDFFK
ncbi:MAG: 2-oxo acid dehydrogenase subunit E2 [Fimbriimonadaceae bacterium]|nr:2-oxo acid dehydrogenase subunit E2 [Fimbriimonadaceae bacterium]